MADASTDAKAHRDLLFHVRRSVRYNSHRQKHYDWWHRLVVFVALLFGSVSVVTLATELSAYLPTWGKLLPSVVVSGFAGLDLIWGNLQNARMHADFVRQFTDLERRLVGPDGKTDAVIASVRDKLLELEATEPPVLQVLDTLCQNELVRSMGYPKSQHIPVGFWQRVWAQFFDLKAHTLHTPEEPKTA